MTYRRIVVAFSGGLDTTYCVAWLRESTAAEVVTVTVDTGGFDPTALERIEAASRRAGAQRHVVVDGTDQVFNRMITLIIQGNVLRGGLYPLCVSAERLVQAELVARTASEFGADAVAHGSTGAGNDQVRFDVAFRTMAPELVVLAPIRDQGVSRAAETDWLRARGIPVSEDTTTYSINAGLWGVTIGGGDLHDPWKPVPNEAYPTVVAPEAAPREGTEMVVGFDAGVPTSLDGKAMAGPALVRWLNQLGARHGVGRGVHLGDTILGIKGRIAFEAPAAAILIAAHRELEKLVLTRWQRFWKDQLGEFLGMLIHEALLHDPVYDDIAALVASSQHRVSGEVRVVLQRGLVRVTGTRSRYSLVDTAAATYGETQALWSGRDAAGFCRIYGLQGSLARKAHGKAVSTEGES
jgi:argininosuccinate synthase